jgi:predicted membrane-bound dolichyl-phosphate-mannose-protein mannosyltransferase
VYGICPLALRLGIDVLSESTYVFFIVLFFLWFVDRRYLLAGVAIGMAYVTRPEAVVVVIGVVIAEIINWLRCCGRHGYRMAVNRKR